MGLTTLKDYADRNNVTYEAVRSQVARYREELGEHIVKDGRQQFLDAYAVAFLDDHRARNPVVVYNASKDEEIERLRLENEQLLKKVAALSDWKAEKALEIAAAAHTQLLLDTAQGQLEEARREIFSKENEVAAARQEAAAAAQRVEEAVEAVSEKDSELDQVRQELEEATRKAAEAEAYAQALKNRGFFARLLRKGE